MKKIAFVFSGQGAQYPGMGQTLADASSAAKAVFDLCDSIRPGTSAQCFTGTKEELTITSNTQPDMFAVEVAAAAALVEAGITPDALAGFSVGEIGALAFSGALSVADSFQLVCRRGELMQEASNAADTGMTAVVKLSERFCKFLVVFVQACQPFFCTDHIFSIRFIKERREDRRCCYGKKQK